MPKVRFLRVTTCFTTTAHHYNNGTATPHDHPLGYTDARSSLLCKEVSMAFRSVMGKTERLYKIPWFSSFIQRQHEQHHTHLNPAARAFVFRTSSLFAAPADHCRAPHPHRPPLTSITKGRTVPPQHHIRPRAHSSRHREDVKKL